MLLCFTMGNLKETRRWLVVTSQLIAYICAMLCHAPPPAPPRPHARASPSRSDAQGEGRAVAVCRLW